MREMELDLQDLEDSFNMGLSISKTGLSVHLSMCIMVEGWHGLYFLRSGCIEGRAWEQMQGTKEETSVQRLLHHMRGEVLPCVVATDAVGKHLGSSSEHEGRRKI